VVLAPWKDPSQFVEWLQRLGPTFVKIGQFLALRPDILPQEYCDALLRLVDRVPPFAWPEVEETLTVELGRAPSETFAYFQRKSTAAGSLAQVHRARLQDGAEAAVKVQRPALKAVVQRDLRRLRRVANVFEKTSVGFAASPREVVDEIESWLLQELDFRRELENLERMRSLVGESSIQRIPASYRVYCTSRVLTAEYLGGTPVSSVLRALRSTTGPQTALRDVDCRLFAERLLTAMLTQIFRYRFFHADPHPGNLLVLPGNVVGFVDFGLCDEIDDTIRESQFRYLDAVYSGDAGRIFKALSEILIPGPLTDMEAFRRDFLAETRSSTARTKGAGKNDAERSPISNYLIGVMRAARRNNLRVPTRVLAMYRALLTVETVAGQLGFGDGLREVGARFFAELQRREFLAQKLNFENVERLAAGVLMLAREAPSQLRQILRDASSGSLAVKVEASESPRRAHSENQRARLLTLAVASIGFSILLATPVPTYFGISLHLPIGVLLIFLYIRAFWLWRKL
jgi:ubiquinone biosynthesis protein